MVRKYWRGRELDLDPDSEPEDDRLGPDERDADLLEDRWESVHWEQPRPPAPPLLRFGIIALSIIAVLSILIPMIAVVIR